jgi:hypothetical protein
MGSPLVWLWLSQAAAQVAPLSVTLHAEAPCPAPGAESPLLRLPTGCPAPWAGVLYTEAHHLDLRQRAAQVDALAVARGKRADVAESALRACRAQRDQVTNACVVGVARVEGAVEALSDLSAPPEPPVLWPWAALSGGLATLGAGVGALADRGPVEVIGYGLAGAAVGAAVAWMVSRWAR